jgi:hypothetical protein
VNLPKQVQVVKAQIAEAFRDVPYPGDGELVLDQTGRDPEGMEIAEAFRRMEWQSISSETVREHATALPLFTPAAFRYFLPAYMTASLDGYYDLDVAPHSTVFNLTPPTHRAGEKWLFFWDRAQGLTQSEREAVAAFLEVIAEYERMDWASAGMEPPEDRVGPALKWWRESAADS